MPCIEIPRQVFTGAALTCANTGVNTTTGTTASMYRYMTGVIIASGGANATPVPRRVQIVDILSTTSWRMRFYPLPGDDNFGRNGQPGVNDAGVPGSYAAQDFSAYTGGTLELFAQVVNVDQFGNRPPTFQV